MVIIEGIPSGVRDFVAANREHRTQEKGGHALPETQVLTDLSADVLENVKAPVFLVLVHTSKEFPKA